MGNEAVQVCLRGQVPCWGHLAEPPGTSHGSPASCGRPAPGVPNAGAGSKANWQKKQTATGSLWKQMLGHPALGFPGQKMPIGAPRSRLQVGARSVLPAVDERGADRPRLSSSLLQSKRDGTAMWGLPGCSLGVWEPSPGAVPQGPLPLPLPTDLPASTSQRG